ncbi:hypothetical protein AVEN_113509-1 [Araneus ventricosus]|uniref:Helitron helicase-like domain-containing protein n=1 Tax=Araneus ventricosus TaxID=182803 RepID=A0A4Y2IAX4_ARAVE|nr:hypothetical protein AVEN_113509-1 [Araneus ventricosus]
MVVSTWAKNKESMGSKKLPPEEAPKQIRESVRRSKKKRPDAEEKRREAERKRRAIKRNEPQSTKTTNENTQGQDEYPNPEPVETVVQGDILTKMGIALAPGENKVPISLVFDDLGEELFYPKIYCEKFGNSLGKNLQHMLKSSNLNCVVMIDEEQHLKRFLYSHQKLLHQKLLSCISIQLRHKVFDEDQIIAENLTNPDFVHNLQYKNLAFKFMKNIKSSPAHWSHEKSRRVCSQIRKFGFPTIFLTLSAAENR